MASSESSSKPSKPEQAVQLLNLGFRVLDNGFRVLDMPVGQMGCFIINRLLVRGV
jgi:hypothetical protein